MYNFYEFSSSLINFIVVEKFDFDTGLIFVIVVTELLLLLLEYKFRI